MGNTDIIWNIVLIGFMASGKTTVGEILAKRMERDFVDLDIMIEAAEGVSINEIFATHGEGYFRDLESRMIEEVSDKEDLILAVGGGAVMRKKSVERLKSGGILYLLAIDAAEVMSRIEGDRSRPLLETDDSERRVEELLEKRLAVYEEVSDCEVSTVGREPDEVAEEIERDFQVRVLSVHREVY